jgi:hypothetical protein
MASKANPHEDAAIINRIAVILRPHYRDRRQLFKHAEAWHDYGFTPDQVRQHVAMGHTPAQAAEMRHSKRANAGVPMGYRVQFRTGQLGANPRHKTKFATPPGVHVNWSPVNQQYFITYGHGPIGTHSLLAKYSSSSDVDDFLRGMKQGAKGNPERSAASAAACATGMRAHTKSRRRIEKTCGKNAPHTHTASTRFSQMGVDARTRKLKR